MSGTSIRIVVKSRRRLVRDGICAYMAGWPVFTVVGQTSSIAALPELCVLRRPDAALVETSELNVPTVRDLRRVHTAAPATEITVAYADAALEALEAAAEAGITALVPSSRGLGAVLHAVVESAHPAGRQRPNGAALTDYDMRVMTLMCSGHNGPEMAELLHVSRRTVENHKRRLYSKLAVGNSCQAVSRATALGLVDSVEAWGSPRPSDSGGPPLFVVHGSPGPTVDQVQRALQEAGVPFLRGTPASPTRQPQAHGSRHEHTIVVLVDPTSDDWLALAALKARTVVVWSADPDLPTTVDMLIRGACAVLHGDDVPAHLAAVLSVVDHGYVAVDAAHIKGVAGWMATRLHAGQSAIPELTAREADVLRLIANGCTIRQTATALGITAKTVENTQSRLYRKLGARNRAGALVVAYQLGLVEQHASSSRAPV